MRELRDLLRVCVCVCVCDAICLNLAGRVCVRVRVSEIGGGRLGLRVLACFGQVVCVRVRGGEMAAGMFEPRAWRSNGRGRWMGVKGWRVLDRWVTVRGSMGAGMQEVGLSRLGWLGGLLVFWPDGWLAVESVGVG